MAAKQRSDPNDVAELLKPLLIAQLALTGVPGPRIRAIVACGMHRVTVVLKHVIPKNRGKQMKEAI